MAYFFGAAKWDLSDDGVGQNKMRTLYGGRQEHFLSMTEKTK